MGAIYIGDFRLDGSDLSSAFQVRNSDPLSLNFKVSESEAKIHLRLGGAGFLSLSRTGQRFELFKPNGTEVPKECQGGGGR